MENLNERQQIEEMAKHCPCYFGEKCCIDGELPEKCDMLCQFGTYAEILYTAGYRAQSDKDSSKGCEYCKGRAYTKKPLTVITKYGRRIELVFEFCPNCGRKMKGGAE